MIPASLTPTMIGASQPSDGGLSEVEYLVVAGGGSGGYDNNTGTRAGGGGAGGVLDGTHSITEYVEYTITVGAGGVSGNSVSASGVNGGDSVFDTITADGGGGGGSANGGGPNDGDDGGSGGGSSNGSSTVGTGVAGQGYAGGIGETGGLWGAGGGGGAEAVGGGGQGVVPTGGIGRVNPIAGSTTGEFSTPDYYVGGGGGGRRGASPYVHGSGGLGGGGAFENSGTANTGGGGGGSDGNPASLTGGSGVVVIAYPDTYSTAVQTTGDPTYTNASGNHIYTFLASGTIMFGEGPPVNYVAKYTMDDISGSTLVDESTNSLDGTITGATAVTGLIGDSLSYDAATETVELGNPAALQTTEGTVSVFLKVGSIMAPFNYSFRDAASTSAYMNMYIDTDGTAGMQSARPSQSYNNFVVTPAAGMTSDTWHHFAWVKESSGNVKIYTDGVLSSLTGTQNTRWFDWMSADADEFEIGSFDTGVGNQGSVGEIDHLTIYDYGLSASDIVKLHDEGL